MATRLMKWFQVFLGTVPVIAAMWSSLMWLDVRYMHADIADTRFIELQIKIVEGHISNYNRIMDTGGKLSNEEMTKYEMEKEQLKLLISERNKILGIGNLPQ